ncbi:hypothetical protein O3P69_004326 [Scylla paramamosain]|uniref:Uncharacterized protein n=1 Tax=Scylla paramamosain TaxID=85552 RepID=A0AAW0UDF4_SCYPA
MAPAGGAASARVDVNRPRTEVIGDDSSPGFSGFQSVQQLDSSSETQDELTTGSVLQSTRCVKNGRGNKSEGELMVTLPPESISCPLLSPTCKTSLAMGTSYPFDTSLLGRPPSSEKIKDSLFFHPTMHHTDKPDWDPLGSSKVDR